MRRSLIYFLLFIYPLQAFCDPKPKVKLIFRIDEPLFRLEYQSDLGSIENSIQKELCAVFNEYLSFIEFSSENVNDKFTISLHNNFKRTDDVSIPKDVMFFFELAGPHVKREIQASPWMFQTKSRYGEQSLSEQEFISAVVSKIKLNLKTNYELMVESIFSKIILTNNAHLIAQVKGWALPFTSDSLGIGTQTEFQIEIEKASDFGPATCEYFTKVHVLKITATAPVPQKFKGCFIVKTISDDECDIFSAQNMTIQIKEVTMRTFDRQSKTNDNTVLPENFVPDMN